MRRKLIVSALGAAVLCAAGSCAAACFPVNGNRITGHDLALASPVFASLPGSYTVAVAPEPARPRMFAIAELERLALANHIAPAAPLSEVCFEIPMRRLGEEEIAAAMRRSLPADAELRVIELPQSAVPAGSVEFPIGSLEPLAANADGAQMWRGFVHYAETRKTPVWARVSIVEQYTAVVAGRDLAPNSIVSASSVRAERRTGTPPHEKIAAKIDEVAGRQLTRAVKAGEPIALASLTAPWDVKRGDAVRVEVRSGEARLALDAIAESPAREGDMVDLRNPSSGKLFRAKLGQGARAVLVLNSAPRL